MVDIPSLVGSDASVACVLSSIVPPLRQSELYLAVSFECQESRYVPIFSSRYTEDATALTDSQQAWRKRIVFIRLGHFIVRWVPR